MNEKIFSLIESNVKYFVNGDTIVCKLECHLDTRCNREDDHFMAIILSGVKCNDKSRIYAKGVAKCDKSDTFDLEKGKQIAYRKARKEVYSKIKGVMGEAEKTVARLMDKFNYEKRRYVEAGKKEVESINFLAK